MSFARTAWAVVLLGGAAYAQDDRLSASAPSWKGMEIRFTTRIEPPGTRLPGGVAVEPAQVHRIINDRANKLVFGYKVAVEPNEDKQTATVRIEPFQPGNSQISFEPGATFLGLPKYPVVRDVRVGDTVALDVLVNAATGQKVVDYLTLRRREEPDATQSARDFQLTDVELTVLNPRITVNGKAEPDTISGGVAGAVVWLYAPGHGRFILSLLPNEKLGFARNGSVSGGSLWFRDGTTEFRVECSGPVAPGSGVYHLYVLHESGWRGGDSRKWMLGSADKPEYILRGK